MAPADSLSFASLSQRTIVQLSTISYLVRPRIEAILPSSVSAPPAVKVIPATVIDLTDQKLTLTLLRSSIHEFLDKDDVFQDGFVKGGYIIVRQPGELAEDVSYEEQQSLGRHADAEVLICDENFSPEPELAAFLDENNLYLCVTSSNWPLPQGPYFVIDRSLHQAWRLYADNLAAFTSSVIPDDTESTSVENPRFTTLQSSAFASLISSIAVPSRLYFRQSNEAPLSGVRISIKDNMHLNGVETTLGSKAYTELYGNQNTTAVIVKDLIKKGAVVVGKTKLSAFAGSEVPPYQCIDYFPPWNPRGDGYQGPSGSSSGAAASVAGYDWLDYSFCTDTTGSMRFPATSHGVWGIRTSLGSVSMKGVVPASPSIDTISVMFRSPRHIDRLLRAMNLSDGLKENRPKRIIYPEDWYPLQDSVHQAKTEEFISALEALLGVKRTPLSFKEKWLQSRPEEVAGKTLVECLRGSIGPVSDWEVYHSFDDFRADYKAKFEKTPYVSPSHSQRWRSGDNVTKEALNTGLERIKTYVSWFNRHIFEVDDSGRSDTIVVVPHGRATPFYRDLSEHDGQKGNGVTSTGAVAVVSMLGAAQVVIPIGQVPYESRISGRREYLPVFTTIIGARGYDQVVMQIAYEALKQARWPTEILTGKTMFEADDEDHNVIVSSL